MSHFKFLFLFLLAFMIQNVVAQSEMDALIKSEQLRFETRLLYKKSLLTESYDVVYQRLELEINMNRRWLRGKITSSFKPLKPAFNLIQFDLETTLKVDSVVFHNQKLTFSHENKLLTIQLNKSIPIGSIDSLAVFYQGDPGLNNPYQSYVYDNHNINDPKPIVYTLSEPYGAKAWWPSKESLSDKIDSLDVVLTVEKGNKGASNGVLIVSKQINDSQELYHWRHRYPIVTYLVGIAVTNYVEFNDYVVYSGNDSMPIVNYVYPEYLAEAKTKSFETAKMVGVFEKLFGPYPFKKEKYGHAQWNWGGGMEHQTMSFMVNLNFDLVAHELAHQWFGNLATCGSWQDLWLNEGFATYLNALCHEHILSQYDFEYRMNDMRSDIMKEPGGSVFVTDTVKRDRLFSSRLTYSKGAFILHMLRWKLGDDAFYAGVRNYLNRPEVSYGFGTTSDLKFELEKISGQNLTEFFKDWFYGEGYPIYDIKWSHIGNHLTLQIKQTQSHPSVSFYNLPLPFNIIGVGKDTSLILEPITKDNLYTFDLNFIPTNVIFDPHVKVLGKSTVIKVRPSNAPQVQIFPIPVKDQLSVFTYRENIEILSITDICGQQIFQRNFKEEMNLKENQTLDLSKLTSGVYFLKIQTASGSAIKRFLKS